MPRFSFTAIDTGGKERTGLVEAPSADLASSQIKSMGLFPTNLVKDEGGQAGRKAVAAKAVGTRAAPRKKRPIVIGRPINQKGLAQFTRQLSILLESGLPLLRSLEVLASGFKVLRFRVQPCRWPEKRPV